MSKISQKQWDVIYDDLMPLDKHSLALIIIDLMNDEDAERWLQQIEDDKENE